MVFRLTALMLALIMGVPLCWCCTVALPPAVTTEVDSCAACRQHQDAGQHGPATPADDSHSQRRCCAKFNVRNVSPDVAAAPRLVLVDLQTWVWADHDLVPPSWEEVKAPLAPQAPPDPWPAPPLYRQHCALLL